LTRRRDESKPMPDLIVIDGGKGQLGAAVQAAAAVGITNIPIVSLAKREEEVFLPGREDSLRLSRRSPSLRLLQRARDEAHRSAWRTIGSAAPPNDYLGIARNPRDRAEPSAGALERFGSLAGVKSATAAELASLPGFSTKLATGSSGNSRRSDSMSRAFVKEDEEDQPRRYHLPPRTDPSYPAAAAWALLEGANHGDSMGAEAATGHRWGDPILRPQGGDHPRRRRTAW
jgi:hypothetical protein